jgi:MFS family permease
MAAAMILSVMAAFNIVGGLSAGALSDILGRKAVSLICALIGAGSLFWLLTIPGDLWLLLVFAALFGISFGGIPAIISATTGDIFGVLNIGKIMGVIGVAWFIGAAIGSLVGGAIFDIYQSYFLAFLIAAVCMVIVFVFLSMLKKPKTAKP